MRQRFRTFKTLRVTLASGEAAVTGRRAHISTDDGLCYADPGEHTDLLPAGRFMETFTGDWQRTTVIDLFEEIRADAWQNDSPPNNVQATDLFQEVFLADGTTVSTSDEGGTRSSGGRAILIENGLVYVRAPRL